jgi:hypothetical protein
MANAVKEELPMNYKELSNENKIAAIMECNFRRSELAVIEQYIEALKTNDHAAIEEFESFGGSPYQMVQNHAHFVRASFAFGFTRTALNKHGWLKGEVFLDCETFYFGCGIKGNLMGRNSLTIGRGPNGKWTYGLHLAASQSGRFAGLSVFCDPYDSRRECLRHGLEEMIAWHIEGKDRKTTAVIREAKDMLDEITGRKQKQLSLF